MRFLAVTGAIAIVFAAQAPSYVRHYALPISAASGIYSCFFILLVLALAPGFPASRRVLQQLSDRFTSYIFLALSCLSYLVYAAGAGDFSWLALTRLVAIAAALLLLYSLLPIGDPNSFCWQDVFVALVLILVVLSHQLAGIWRVPVNLDFMGRLFLLAAGSWCWLFVRPVPGLGYDFHLPASAPGIVARNFAYFAAIAIPLGFILGFTAWNPRWHGIAAFCANYLEIFLFVALLEELFFRGFLQNLLSRSFGSWVGGQLLASLLFGLFHILHAPFPNWRYVVLASIAGWFYGSTYRQSGTIAASALVHATVDTVWRVWLTRA